MALGVIVGSGGELGVNVQAQCVAVGIHGAHDETAQASSKKVFPDINADVTDVHSLLKASKRYRR